jgi:hypothetical protein
MTSMECNVIHHMSFAVHNPERVAGVLCELTGATAVRAPAPPFPRGAWFVVAGDDRGSMLELLPAGTVYEPSAPFGLRKMTPALQPVSAHVLISSIASKDEIEAVAEREGWQLQEVETGLFRIVKLWVDGVVLVELFAKGEAERYVANFGRPGLATLDGKFRELERTISDESE